MKSNPIAEHLSNSPIKVLDQNSLQVAYSKHRKTKLWSPIDSLPKSDRTTLSERGERAVWSLQQIGSLAPSSGFSMLTAVFGLLFGGDPLPARRKNLDHSERTRACHHISVEKNIGLGGAPPPNIELKSIANVSIYIYIYIILSRKTFWRTVCEHSDRNAASPR